MLIPDSKILKFPSSLWENKLSWNCLLEETFQTTRFYQPLWESLGEATRKLKSSLALAILLPEKQGKQDCSAWMSFVFIIH